MSKSDTKEPKADDAAIEAIELRAFRLAQLAASLMSSRVQHFYQQGHPRDLTDPTWDLEFNSALKRAEMLIRSIEERDVDIHAYQIFREGDVLTEERIADDFKRVGWAGLSSKQPVTKLMRTLRGWMEEHFAKETALNPFNNDQEISEAMRKVADCLGPLIDDSLIKDAIPDFRKMAEKFMNGLSESIPLVASSHTHHEWTAAEAENEAFKCWCFPFEESVHGTVRKYRPHEIFRFAAKMKWIGVVPLSSLAKTFMPFPQRPHLDARFAKFDKAYTDPGAYWLEQSIEEPKSTPTSEVLDGDAPRAEAHAVDG
jgi:hypothetical protein